MSKWIMMLMLIVLPAAIWAGALKIVGNIPVIIPSTDPDESNPPGIQSQVILLQQIRLSEQAQQILSNRVQAIFESDAEDEPLLWVKQPKSVNLGMNNTPVLNQGAHGSCVTFAITGALDAIIGNGDQISQFCSLALGSYLKKHQLSKYSGWNGSFGPVVLKQLNDYGIVGKGYQRVHGCAGLKTYPVSDSKNKGKPMSISEYTAYSVALDKVASWDVLVDIEQAFTNNHNPVMVLKAVKKSLIEGNRLTFGVLLDTSFGHAGALGHYQKNYDSWVLTPEIVAHAKQAKIEGGHEMIIIGYDDEAVIRDPNGRVSKGLLILRNSWGGKAGHKGNYYMSYAYFKALSDELQVIKSP